MEVGAVGGEAERPGARDAGVSGHRGCIDVKLERRRPPGARDLKYRGNEELCLALEYLEPDLGAGADVLTDVGLVPGVGGHGVLAGVQQRLPGAVTILLGGPGVQVLVTT